MALPNFGNPISMNQVNVELNLAGTTTISLNQASVRTLFQIASGAISMYDGFGKSNAYLATVNAYTSTPSYRCYNWSFENNISWYINSGTGPISVYLEIAPTYTNASPGNANGTPHPTSFCTFFEHSLLGTVSPGTWVDVSAKDFGLSSPSTASYNRTYRLRMENAAGTSYSPNIGVAFNPCDQYDYCSATNNCIDDGTLACRNCNQVCNCPACTFDCNCDCATAFGTGGCNCGSDCGWCQDPDMLVCTGCCDEFGNNCYCDCTWESNPNFPCPCGRIQCETTCYCPCPETCATGSTRRVCQIYDPNVFMYAPGYSAC